jgi:hypothetical protein
MSVGHYRIYSGGRAVHTVMTLLPPNLVRKQIFADLARSGPKASATLIGAGLSSFRVTARCQELGSGLSRELFIL